MTDFILNTLKINLFAAACIAAAVIFGKLFEKKYTARWKYFVWLFLALFLLIPVNFSSALSVWSIKLPIAQAEPIPVPTSAGVSAPQTAGTFTEASSENHSPGATDLPAARTSDASRPQNAFSRQALSAPLADRLSSGFLIVWITGILLAFLIRFTGGRIAILRLNKANLPAVSSRTLRLYARACSELELPRSPQLLVNSSVVTPLLAGLTRPRLYLPDRNYSDEELELIFLHELAHYKKKDLWYKLLLLTAGTVYWFNPALRFMLADADQTLEYLCDETVVRRRDKRKRLEYSRLLLRAAEDGQKTGSYLSSGLNDGAADLKKRMLNILDGARKRSGILIACVLILTLAVSNALIGCTTSATSEPPVSAPADSPPADNNNPGGDAEVTQEPQPSDSLPAEMINQENLEAMLPIFDTAAIVAQMSAYSYDNLEYERYFWNAVSLAAVNFVIPGSDKIVYPTYSDDFTGVACSSEGVRYTDDGYLQVPAWIVRELAAALFAGTSTLPELPVSRSIMYDESGDFYSFAMSDHSEEIITIEDFTADGSAAASVSLSFASPYAETPDPFRLTLRIVKNTFSYEGRKPLFPYAIEELSDWSLPPSVRALMDSAGISADDVRGHGDLFCRLAFVKQPFHSAEELMAVLDAYVYKEFETLQGRPTVPEAEVKKYIEDTFGLGTFDISESYRPFISLEDGFYHFGGITDTDQSSYSCTRITPAENGYIVDVERTGPDGQENGIWKITVQPADTAYGFRVTSVDEPVLP